MGWQEHETDIQVNYFIFAGPQRASIVVWCTKLNMGLSLCIYAVMIPSRGAKSR